MVSDYSNGESGFNLEYSIKGCGDSLSKPQGNFTSPNYPASSSKEQECVWGITIEFGSLIQLSIEDMDIPASDNCSQDALLVYYTKDMVGDPIPHCGPKEKLPIVLTSHSNEMYVRFRTNAVHGGRGFKASYRTVPLSN